MSETPQTVICLKWGDRYGPEFVNRLHSMVARNTSRPLRFVCLTDDPGGLADDVETLPMPAFDLPEEFRFHPFRRMFLFQERLEGLSGDILHFDLDIVVTGSIDGFFDHKPGCSFCVTENWTQPGAGIGNMSVFRFRVGAHTNIWDMFRANPAAQKRKYRNSQTFFSRNARQQEFFPPDWCLSFKHSLLPRWPLNFLVAPKLPGTARVVAFTGKPDQDEALKGVYPAKWWKRIYKHVRPTPWIGEHWR